MLNIAKQFALDSAPVSCEKYGNGHINGTFLVITETGRKYILQKINTNIFKDPRGLMNNISAVTAYLSTQDRDPRRVLQIVKTVSGDIMLESDGFWRMYDFVTDSLCLEKAETAEDFRQSGEAFGDFQRRLADFPAETLNETIPHFHDTPDRYRQLHEAIDNDRAGRAASVQAEIQEALSHEAEASYMMNLLNAGELPLRVTHNDTKLNNVMLDAATRKPLCVIDLDTVMPGLAANDFGDSIRFGASTAAEDEKDLSKVTMSLDLFRAFAEGFLGACGKSLTEKEIETLPMGAKLMTLECGIRFLADYLNGDTYFRTAYPEHNLDRCHTQFKLVRDMESKWDEMCRIVKAV